MDAPPMNTPVTQSSTTIAGAGAEAPEATGWWAGVRERYALSPLNRRRWENFKANKRGYWSLRILLALFVITGLAEFIANDRPLVASYKGEMLFPVLVDYPETKFEGGFRATTQYRDPAIQDEINKHGWMVWPLIRFSYDTENKDYVRRKNAEGICLGYPAPPPWSTSMAPCDTDAAQLERYHTLGNTNWLGLDSQGRDVLARVIYGFRLSLMFAIILTSLASVIGIAAGAVQGYFGGKIDLVAQRMLEIWTSVPSLFVLLTVSAVLEPGFWTLLGILLLFEWVTLVGVVRAEFLRGRNFEYVRAAKALGLSDGRIMFKHVLPNAMVATLTFLPFALSGSVSALTALDFLGLGLPPGSPSLGELLLQGKKNLEAPWLGLTGFFVIATLLSLLIFIGGAVRDALDPRKTFK